MTNTDLPAQPPRHAGFWRFVRNCITGGLASVCYFAVYLPLKHFTPLSQTAADNLGLIVGAVAQFVGCRYFVFRARAGSLPKQAAGFALAELFTLLLNIAVLWIMRALLPAAIGEHDLLALFSTFLVFAAFSYPVWHLVFKR
ncbi:MAG: GtrA family protein [Planctomycetes bacterium]|nr:GtrA family protein [Planctomycetota bacterium]